MNRRQFLVRVGGSLVVVPLGLGVLGCGDDGGPSQPNPPADRFTVTNTDGTHPHTFEILCTQLAAGVAVDVVATGSGHTHTIALDSIDVQAIAAGLRREIDTNDGHAHRWIIQKPAGVC